MACTSAIARASFGFTFVESCATNEALADLGGVNIHAGAAIDGLGPRAAPRPRPPGQLELDLAT